jgi:hypothetical protein
MEEMRGEVRGGFISGCEEVSFGEGKFDAKRFAKFGKFGKFIKEERNVSIVEWRGVINDGGCVCLGAKGDVTRLLIIEKSEFRMIKEKRVDLIQKYGKS